MTQDEFFAALENLKARNKYPEEKRAKPTKPKPKRKRAGKAETHDDGGPLGP
jgi:hypothetical protein